MRETVQRLSRRAERSKRRSSSRPRSQARQAFGRRTPPILRSAGKQAKCQVAVSLSVANHAASLPVAYRPHLLEAWTKDRVPLKKEGVPKQIKFKTKRRSRWSKSVGPERAVCEAASRYGCGLRQGRAAACRHDGIGRAYVVGIVPTISMWAPGSGPRRMDKPINNIVRCDEPELVSAKKVALGLPKQAWRMVTRREGSADQLSSRIARGVSASDNKLIPEKLSPQWLLIEWPEGEVEPTQYWLSTLPESISSRSSSIWPSCAGVSSATIRNSSRVGHGHYEGRGWRGFHHHATLCIAAYGFLIAEQATNPPSGPRSATSVQVPPLPDNYRPRGSAFAA